MMLYTIPRVVQPVIGAITSGLSGGDVHLLLKAVTQIARKHTALGYQFDGHKQM